MMLCCRTNQTQAQCDRHKTAHLQRYLFHKSPVSLTPSVSIFDLNLTMCRLFVRRGMSIKYLLPNSVIQYIYDNKLYRDTDAKAIKR